MRVVHPLEIWELVADELTTSSVTVWDGRLVSQRGGNSSVFPLEKAHQKSSRREHKFLNNLDPGVSGRRAPLGSNDLEKKHTPKPTVKCVWRRDVCVSVCKGSLGLSFLFSAPAIWRGGGLTFQFVAVVSRSTSQSSWVPLCTLCRLISSCSLCLNLYVLWPSMGLEMQRGRTGVGGGLWRSEEFKSR